MEYRIGLLPFYEFWVGAREGIGKKCRLGEKNFNQFTWFNVRRFNRQVTEYQRPQGMGVFMLYVQCEALIINSLQNNRSVTFCFNEYYSEHK